MTKNLKISRKQKRGGRKSRKSQHSRRRKGGNALNASGYPMLQSLMQGRDFELMHEGQHGGQETPSINSQAANSQAATQVANSSPFSLPNIGIGNLFSSEPAKPSAETPKNEGIPQQNIPLQHTNLPTTPQNGGMHGLYPSSVTSSMLPPDMQGSAMTSGTMAAYNQITGMKDSTLTMTGGRCGTCGNKTIGGKRKSKSRKGGRRRRGGMMSLTPSPLPMKGLLLNSQQYTKAGLNPDYTGAATEYQVAKQRNSA